MLDFQALAEAKADARQINDKVQQRFIETYDSAVSQVMALHQLSCEAPERRLPERLLRQAVDTLAKAIDLKPSAAQPYALYSCLFFLMEDLPRARKYLQTARELNPGFPKIAALEALYNDFEALEALHQQLPADAAPTPPRIKPLETFDDFQLADI
ncbi:MAG: hypothetical protein IGS03_09825 [Candidatus Sericytochromatia bacterium]|nr:hypothetical protein [Candidatus Sericytochromatia bacterium]